MSRSATDIHAPGERTISRERLAAIRSRFDKAFPECKHPGMTLEILRFEVDLAEMETLAESQLDPQGLGELHD
jgi:hypothetical protein